MLVCYDIIDKGATNYVPRAMERESIYYQFAKDWFEYNFRPRRNQRNTKEDVTNRVHSSCCTLVHWGQQEEQGSHHDLLL